MTHGTLLGAVRDGDLIPWTNDADLHCLEGDRAAVEAALNLGAQRLGLAWGYPALAEGAARGGHGVPREYLVVSNGVRGVSLDVGFVRRGGGGGDGGAGPAHLVGIEPGSGALCDPSVWGAAGCAGDASSSPAGWVRWDDVFPLRRASVRGVAANAPARPERLLARMFGAGWRVPDRGGQGAWARCTVHAPEGSGFAGCTTRPGWTPVWRTAGNDGGALPPETLAAWARLGRGRGAFSGAGPRARPPVVHVPLRAWSHPGLDFAGRGFRAEDVEALARAVEADAVETDAVEADAVEADAVETDAFDIHAVDIHAVDTDDVGQRAPSPRGRGPLRAGVLARSPGLRGLATSAGMLKLIGDLFQQGASPAATEAALFRAGTLRAGAREATDGSHAASGPAPGQTISVWVALRPLAVRCGGLQGDDGGVLSAAPGDVLAWPSSGGALGGPDGCLAAAASEKGSREGADAATGQRGALLALRLSFRKAAEAAGGSER
jgi:hypothetical protein